MPSDTRPRIYRCADDPSLDLFWVVDADSGDAICLTSAQCITLAERILKAAHREWKNVPRMPQYMADLLDAEAKRDE